MAKNTDKDREMAKRLRDEGVMRTTGRCGVCYRVVTIDSLKSKNRHIGNCWK